jgi:hypothetical protein
MCFSVKRGSITMMDLAQINYDSGLERVFAGNSAFSGNAGAISGINRDSR